MADLKETMKALAEFATSTFDIAAFDVGKLSDDLTAVTAQADLTDEQKRDKAREILAEAGIYLGVSAEQEGLAQLLTMLESPEDVAKAVAALKPAAPDPDTTRKAELTADPEFVKMRARVDAMRKKEADAKAAGWAEKHLIAQDDRVLAAAVLLEHDEESDGVVNLEAGGTMKLGKAIRRLIENAPRTITLEGGRVLSAETGEPGEAIPNVDARTAKAAAATGGVKQTA